MRRYRGNPQLLASDAAELLREQGIPVIPQALDVGDLDAEVIWLGDSVEIAELPDATFMVSVNCGDEWELESVEYSLEDAIAVASSCYEMSPNARELKTRMIGQCPVCEGYYRLNRGKMVHHGYKRPGTGEIHGDCYGVHHLAYELSAEGCENYLYICNKNRAGTIEHLRRLERGEITEVQVEQGWGRNKKFVYLTRGDDGFDQAIENRIRQAKRAISEYDSEIERMEKRIADWVPAQVKTFEEYEAAQRTAPDRLKAQAEREAKRAAKAEKARLQAEKQERWEAEKRALMDRYREIFATCSRSEAPRHWREMYRAMNKKSYLHFYDKWLGIDERLIELGLARIENGRVIYAYPDGSLRE